jgi:transcriptional regulator with XRE-family HTH domain
MRTRTLLATLGHRIRTGRTDARLTQAALGKRAGIVGKYVSEIERGTRDLPLSTLTAVVERGLGMDLDIVFRARGSGSRVSVPSAIDAVAGLIAELPSDQQARVLTIVHSILELAR